MFGQQARLVLAVPHIWLCETLRQMLSHEDIEVECVQTLDKCLESMQQPAAVVIVDVFGFSQPYDELLAVLRGAAPATHIIALLSTDSIDYREAVMRGGASAVLLQEKAGEELVPLVAQLLRIDMHRASLKSRSSLSATWLEDT